MESVLDELGYLASMHGTGPQRRGPCPLHDDPHERHRSFSVHLGKGVFRCFHPQCQAQGNVLDLWSHRTGLPLRDAAIDLAKRFGVATQEQRRATVLKVKRKYHTATSLQGVLLAIIVFRIVRSFRMHAVSATLAGLPAFRSL